MSGLRIGYARAGHSWSRLTLPVQPIERVHWGPRRENSYRDPAWASLADAGSAQRRAVTYSNPRGRPLLHAQPLRPDLRPACRRSIRLARDAPQQNHDMKIGECGHGWCCGALALPSPRVR